MSDLTLYGLIEAHSSDDIELTAVAIEDALHLRIPQRQVLHKLIVDEVRRCWRNGVRPLEPRSDAPATNPTQGRSDYLKARFSLPDGRHPTWGDATVEDHLLRIDMLSKLRHGLDLTIKAHEDAVAKLTDAGVSCLNDLPATDEVAA